MSARHDEFEVLCALAVSGDLTKMEHAALHEHLRDCLSCQNYLIEMRRLAIPLLLAQQLRTPGKQLRKDLQERFAERAIRSGIPLSPRPAGVDFNSLGMATVVLVVLLLVTATLQHASRSSIADSGVVEPTRVSASLHGPSSMTSLPAPATLRRIRRDHKPAAFPMAKPGHTRFEPAALQSHPFSFALYARSFAGRTYPLSTTLKLTEVVPSLTFPSRASGLTPDAAGAFAPAHLLSNRVAQRLDPDTYRNTWKANFKMSGFELIHNVGSETDGQESSQ
jgi:hypothetical protein